MKATLEFAVTQDDVSLNIYNIRLNIKQLQEEADDYIKKAALTEGDKSKYYEEVEKIFLKIKELREKLDVLEASKINIDTSNSELNRITQILENSEFTIDKYDDLLVRRLVSCIKIMSNKTIKVIFKGGYEVIEALDD